MIMGRLFSQVKVNCKTCNKEFSAHRYRLKTVKFCSHKCRRQTLKARELISLHSAVPKGDRSPLWKGVNVGYHGLHKWIQLIAGKPLECELCGTTISKKFEWANRSKKYLRLRSDWIRLCTSCHRIYDGHMSKAWITRRINAS